MTKKSKAFAALILSFVIATLTISVASTIDSQPVMKNKSKEQETTVIRWGEGDI